MTEWIIPCNPKAYDVIGAFNKLEAIDWKQSVNVSIGDIVYIYIGKPFSAIMFKCVAVAIDLPEVVIDDSEFETDTTNYGNYGRYMELKRITSYEENLLIYHNLKSNGLRSVQGPSKINEELLNYIWNMIPNDREVALNIDDDFFNVEGEDLTGEEIEALIKTRIGQSKFKRLLTDKYHACVLCGIDFEPLLIASHIKPWCKSNGKEKVDVNNGLLLCPHHDQLFDKGYISFDDKGKILISSLLAENTRVLMNVEARKKIIITNEMSPYMRWHRENVFMQG